MSTIQTQFAKLLLLCFSLFYHSIYEAGQSIQIVLFLNLLCLQESKISGFGPDWNSSDFVHLLFLGSCSKSASLVVHCDIMGRHFGIESVRRSPNQHPSGFLVRFFTELSASFAKSLLDLSRDWRVSQKNFAKQLCIEAFDIDLETFSLRLRMLLQRHWGPCLPCSMLG